MKRKAQILSIILLMIGLIVLLLINELKPLVVKVRDNDLVSHLDKLVPKLMKKYRVPGAAVASINEGEVEWVQGYGWGVNQKQPVNPDTVFQVASNSKTLTAWGIMKLVGDGKLDLDAPVEQYLKRWSLPDSKFDKDQVTIRRILSHTGGLSVRSYAGYPPDIELPSLEESLSGKVKGLSRLELVREPGINYRYSGGGYTLLQLVIEEVTGEPFSHYMEEEILRPLGMNDSSFEWKDVLQKKTTTAYDLFGRVLPNFIFTEQAAAGLYTTATDLAKFVAANLPNSKGEPSGRRIIDQGLLETMYIPVTTDLDYGLGYIIKKLPNGQRLIHHGGTNRGWRSQFAFIPESGVGLVVLTNSDNGEKLHSDLVSRWTKWKTDSLSDLQIKGIVMRVLIKSLAILLLLLLGGSCRNTVKHLSQSKSDIGFQSRGLGKVFSLFIKGLLPIIFILSWWILFYTGLVSNGWLLASLMPSGFHWLTGAVIIWGTYLCFKTIVVQNREPRKN